jgi:hypothetical protein
MYCVFLRLYEVFFCIFSTLVYMYIYWPLAFWEYKLLFLTWYQSFRFFFFTRATRVVSDPISPASPTSLAVVAVIFPRCSYRRPSPVPWPSPVSHPALSSCRRPSPIRPCPPAVQSPAWPPLSGHQPPLPGLCLATGRPCLAAPA